MGNTFDAVPPPAEAHERSAASLATSDPQGMLERLVEEAGKHRGTLREQDGCTIAFREGGSVRVRVAPQGADDAPPRLSLVVDAPTTERREHVERTLAQLVADLGAGADALDWEPAGEPRQRKGEGSPDPTRTTSG